MEKIINLEMKDNKDIVISMNGVPKKTILESNRALSAQDIYDIIDFNVGDKLSVEQINVNDLDKNVLSFFSDMFSDICKTINNMDFSENSPTELEITSE